jgi:signal transduction histidine kinase
MAFSRSFGAIGAASGIAAAAVAGTLAAQGGLYFTLLLAILLVIWLTGSVWRVVTRPAASATPPAAPDDEGGRIMLRAMLDQAPGPLLVVEGGSRVRALNRAARRLFGADDVLSRPPADLLSADVARTVHGHRHWRIDRVAAQGLGPPRMLIALVDIEAEEQAAEARATRELLQVLGHEVMNALAPITSLAESALAAATAAPESRERLLPEILGTLSRRADGLRRFTEAYRQMARLPEPVPRVEPIDEMLEDLARLFMAQWREKVSFTIDAPAAMTAVFDRDQILQALWALARNGAEAALSAARPACVSVSARIDQERLLLRIQDSGDGVSAEHRPNIFRAFYTNKPEGHGIGLTVARQIALAHGGDLTCGYGDPTTFELAIPQMTASRRV